MMIELMYSLNLLSCITYIFVNTYRLLTGLPSLAKIGSVIAKTKSTCQMENAKNECVSVVRFRMRVARSKALNEASKTR